MLPQDYWRWQIMNERPVHLWKGEWMGEEKAAGATWLLRIHFTHSAIGEKQHPPTGKTNKPTQTECVVVKYGDQCILRLQEKVRLFYDSISYWRKGMPCYRLIGPCIHQKYISVNLAFKYLRVETWAIMSLVINDEVVYKTFILKDLRWHMFRC